MGNNHKIRWSIFSCLIQAVKCRKFPSYPWSAHILVYDIYKLNMRHTLYIFCRVYEQYFLNYVGMCHTQTILNLIQLCRQKECLKYCAVFSSNFFALIAYINDNYFTDLENVCFLIWRLTFLSSCLIGYLKKVCIETFMIRIQTAT